jgi:succinate dehydrogenase/fumarate reductase flavoprotein subunit
MTERNYEAGAVVLCTGGFAGNADLMRKYKLPQAREILSDASPSATGDGLIMCQDIGAKIVNLDQSMLPYMGSVPDPDNKGRVLAHVNMDKYPGVIWVNLDGKRVINEDGGSLNPPPRLAMLHSPEMVLIPILDKKIMDDNAPILVDWFSLPGQSWEWFDKKAEEGTVIKKANTIEELGHSLGVNVQNLKDTITKWNEYVEAGKDLDFGRKELSYKIAKPPFYAIKTVSSVLISSGGPAVNVRQQVLDKTDKVIQGLYAAGELTGFRGFGTGSSNTGCIVFGKQAGIMAAQYALYHCH